MEQRLLAEVLERLQQQYGLKPRAGARYLRGGTCPACGKKELYTRAESPWVVRCGRESKCAAQWHVKDLFADLFDDWSRRAPATEDAPDASAIAYLEFARGLRVDLVKGRFTQEHFFNQELGIGSATIRFALEHGGYWERLIDQPQRFGKMKARFKRGESYQGHWWACQPAELEIAREVWIVEGIFDAIALSQNGLTSVAALSSNAFPTESLKALAAARAGDLPTLIWALDNEPGAHRYTRRWVKQARAMGFTCHAAQIPQRDGRKVDWNDLHQRWAFLEDEQRPDRVTADLKEARYHGALLIAESAVEKALLMYQWREREEFHFGYESRLYWWKLDISKFNNAFQALESSDQHEDQLLDDKARREKALRMSGGVVEIANCYPRALYFQRNEVTDESWYFFRVDFPHDGEAVKNTFTGAQLAAASEFKKRLLGMGAGAVFTGTGQQLDKIMKDQLFGLKTVQTIDYVGYSKEYGCYLYNDLAVKDGQLVKVNEEEFFEFGKLRLKSLQRGITIRLQPDGRDYSSAWLPLLWTCFGAKGVTALAFWFGSLFAEQIRSRYQSFPFLEATGEAGAGKSTLLFFLWKLFGREKYEGFDPAKGTKSGRSRLMGQTSNMPVVLLESDRAGEGRAHAVTFDFDELKNYYNGGTLATRGMKTAGNETYEPPFRGTIVISQNAAVDASEAVMTRIIKLHFTRGVVTDQSRTAFDALARLDTATLSHFLVKAVKNEKAVMQTLAERIPVHEAKLRRLNTHCASCDQPFPAGQKSGGCACGATEQGYIRVERIITNHAQLMACVDALRLIAPLTDGQVMTTHRALVAGALERQQAISADHPYVTEFWEVYDYLQGLDVNGPVVNHSKNPRFIAVNLNEFAERAAEHRQKLADVSELRVLLPNSGRPKFIDKNRAVDSAVRAYQATRLNANSNKSPTVKCWIFEA
ncbi:toprim domain-containing protein [Pseudomonas japonica]|uniref:toprim domain-containing protein n=1 Tax=Pseudomonas japonica TaxID=256466 RepID=UPI0015E4114A|nr:toprim domain-containing protein [Pseudomonas japonica]MBA1289154.1 bifunctional DNA primase/helicase [Pseudomonas japonica]